MAIQSTTVSQDSRNAKGYRRQIRAGNGADILRVLTALALLALVSTFDRNAESGSAGTTGVSLSDQRTP